MNSWYKVLLLLLAAGLFFGGSLGFVSPVYDVAFCFMKSINSCFQPEAFMYGSLLNLSGISIGSIWVPDTPPSRSVLKVPPFCTIVSDYLLPELNLGSYYWVVRVEFISSVLPGEWEIMMGETTSEKCRDRYAMLFLASALSRIEVALWLCLPS